MGVPSDVPLGLCVFWFPTPSKSCIYSQEEKSSLRPLRSGQAGGQKRHPRPHYRGHTAAGPALTCAAPAAGRAAGAPGRASSTSAGRRHSATSTAPSRPAWARAPDAAEDSQAPRPMAPADSLSGLRAARGGRVGAAGGSGYSRGRGGGPRGGGEAGRRSDPEGNQLAVPLSGVPHRRRPGECGPRASGSLAAAWAGPAGRGQLGRGGEEGPFREGRDRRQGLRLGAGWPAGVPKPAGVCE